MNVSVIIPAYNEGEAIKEVIEGVRNVSSEFEIIVVDDGSDDNTAEVASSAGAKVISHPYNIGNGASVKTGVRAATKDYLVFMDGDGQHNPSDIPKLLEDMDKYDMVVGARTKKGKLWFTRSILNSVLNKIASFLANHKVVDLTSGFRAIKRDRMLEFIHLLPNTFSYPSTITLAMFKAGYPVRYVDMDTISKRSKGKSKIKLVNDGVRFLYIVTRIVMLFDPLKFFLPVSVLLFIIGGGLALCQLMHYGGIFGGSVFTLLVSVFIFFFGFLADQIASIRRQFHQR
ncbi:MAG: glycosyltransferase family 2 protein [Armatimonadota bacterium]